MITASSTFVYEISEFTIRGHKEGLTCGVKRSGEPFAQLWREGDRASSTISSSTVATLTNEKDRFMSCFDDKPIWLEEGF